VLDEPLSRDHLLSLAVEMEGHPDNVAPALLGGFQVSALTDDGLVHLRLPTPAGLRAVVCIPDAAVSTEAARRVLPESYSRSPSLRSARSASERRWSPPSATPAPKPAGWPYPWMSVAPPSEPRSREGS
jgi:homoserine kinase